jgi:hypothetical protein
MPASSFSSVQPPIQAAQSLPAQKRAAELVLEELVQFARAGDPIAIAELLTHYFCPLGLQVWAYCEAGHLHLWIAGAKLPERRQLIPWLQESFKRLNPETLGWVTVQGAYQIAKDPEVTFEKAIRESDWSVTFALQEDKDDLETSLAAPSVPQPSTTPACTSPSAHQLLRQYNRGKRQFTEQDFSYADLQGQRLSMGDFRQANFNGANLSYANLSHADLGLANLQNAELVGAELIRANLQGANLQGADLQGANLTWSNLCGANLRNANLEGAILSEVQITLVTLPDGSVLE